MILWLLADSEDIHTLEQAEGIGQLLLEHKLITPSFKTRLEKKQGKVFFQSESLYNYKTPFLLASGVVGVRKRRRRVWGTSSSSKGHHYHTSGKKRIGVTIGLGGEKKKYNSDVKDFKERRIELQMVDGKYKLAEYQTSSGNNVKPVHSHALKAFAIMPREDELEEEHLECWFSIKSSGMQIEYLAPTSKERDMWESKLRKCCGASSGKGAESSSTSSAGRSSSVGRAASRGRGRRHRPITPNSKANNPMTGIATPASGGDQSSRIRASSADCASSFRTAMERRRAVTAVLVDGRIPHSVAGTPPNRSGHQRNREFFKYPRAIGGTSKTTTPTNGNPDMNISRSFVPVPMAKENKNLTVFSATWNCNAQIPSRKALELWLSGESGTAGSRTYYNADTKGGGEGDGKSRNNNGYYRQNEDAHSSTMNGAGIEDGGRGDDERQRFQADLYIIGLQETVELKAREVLLNRDVSRPWQRAIEQALRVTAPKGAYRLVVKTHLVGMLLLVYATAQVAINMDGVHEYTVGVGVMGVGGNKGSVAARFRVYGHRFMVLNCHLTAHQQNVEARNRDLNKIWRRFCVDPSEHGLDEIIFCMGDLNYRIDIKGANIVKKLIEKADWSSLISFEQLTKQRAEGKVFLRFTEGPIHFPPTFKFKVGTNTYNEKRVPAWCDRILWWRDQRVCTVLQRFYRSISTVTESDHKPVCALFDVTLLGTSEKGGVGTPRSVNYSPVSSVNTATTTPLSPRIGSPIFNKRPPGPSRRQKMRTKHPSGSSSDDQSFGLRDGGYFGGGLISRETDSASHRETAAKSSKIVAEEGDKKNKAAVGTPAGPPPRIVL